MKRFLPFVLLVVLLLSWCASAHATWTTQKDLSQAAQIANCSSGTACRVTVTLTSGWGLAVVAMSSGTNAVSSCCNAGCTASWTRGPNVAGANGSTEIWYCTNAASGSSLSVGPTFTSTCSDCETAVGAWSSSLGTIAIDSGTTPTCTKSAAATTNPAECALTVSANNDVYVVGIFSGGSVTGCSASYTCNTAGGDSEGFIINQTSYAATTWTMSSGNYAEAALALQETATAAASGISKQRKLDALDP